MSGAPLAALMIAASLASAGRLARSRSGALTTTRRLRSGSHSFARALTSASVICGRKRWFRANSLTMPGIGSPLTKLRTNSSASGLRWALVLLDDRIPETALEIQPLAIQFRRGEAEAGDTVDFGKEGRKASFDATLGDEGVEGRRLLDADQQSAARFGLEKWRSGGLRNLLEPRRQHAAEESLDHLPPVAANRALVAGGHLAVDADVRDGRLRIGQHGEPGAGLIRYACTPAAAWATEPAQSSRSAT